MKKILKDNLVQAAERDFPRGEWWFLHDNGGTLRSKAVTEQMHRMGVLALDFPPYSPDLNPIENLWATLARAVEEHCCETVAALEAAVREEWKKIDKQHLRNLVRSMPERCAAVIEADGYHTKY